MLIGLFSNIILNRVQYTGCANRLWTSYVMAFENYRLTDSQADTTEIILHSASRVVKVASIDYTDWVWRTLVK